MAEAAVATGFEARVPEHVPPELVIESDFFSDPGYATDPFAVVAGQTTGPRVFYSPTHYLLPGGWVVTRAEDVRHVLQHPELFSSKGQVSFSALIDEAWDLIPVELDPPHHARYRNLLNPLFSPKEVGKMEAGVRAAAVSLIEAFAGAREVEFVSAFAQPFPVSVFLNLLGLPLAEMHQFLAWEHGLLKSFHLADRKAAAASIVGYLRRTAAERRLNPGDDLVSWAVRAEVDGQPLAEDEIIGICFLLFVAGLDTVASSLGFHYHHLASHPELQARLRADRGLIPTAVEEFMRLYSVVINHRRVVTDTEIAGVRMRAGDWMSVPTFNGSRDPAEFEDPHSFVLDRPSNRHVAFSYGPHRCLGSHLARRELVVAMNEIFDRLPPFRLKDGAPFRTVGGAVFGVEELHLVFRSLIGASVAAADPMREFRDAKEIADKLGLWCRIVDTRALERMPEVFDADVEWDFGKDTVDRSLADVIVRIRAHLIDESECGPTQHHLANPRIDIDGDAAESEAYFLAAHAGVGAQAGRTLLQWGNYNDFWRRTAAGWRVVRRIYRITISDGPMEIVYGNGTGAMWREGDERRIGA